MTLPRALGVLAGLAILALLPSIVLGVNPSDSVQYNVVWATQFAELVRSGHWLPRWLPGSFGGLGSPAMEFYPPFAFYIDAAVAAVTADALPVPQRLGLSTAVLAALSGAAMLGWLRSLVPPRAALLGAAAYMLAPYHLADHYWRGAFAEFSAFVFIPVLALGMQRAARGWRGVPILAAGLAGAIIAHLPTALLLCVVMLPMQAFGAIAGRGRDAGPLVARLAIGGVLGLGLAGFYLAPALLLQGLINTDVFWASFYTPAPWLFLHVDDWPVPPLMVMIVSFAAAAALLCLGALAMTRRAGAGGQPRLWAATGLLCFALMAGLVPFFWTAVPLVAKVQFPWRLMSLTEFAAITAIAIAASQGRTGRVGGATALLAGLAVAPGLLILAAHTAPRVMQTPDFWAANGPRFAANLPDAAEYTPHGLALADVALAQGPGPFAPGRPASVACEPAASPCAAATPRQSGSMRVQIGASVPTTVTVGRFYFPVWQAERDGAPLDVHPGGPFGFVQFTVPPGGSDVLLRVRRTPIEDWGIACSLAALAIVLAWSGLALRAARRERLR